MERRQRERDEDRGRHEEAEERPALHARHHDSPEAALVRRVPADQRQPQRVHPVAEQRENGGEQRRRSSHGSDPDEHRAGREAAEDRVRHEQHPGQAITNAVPLKKTARFAVRPVAATASSFSMPCDRSSRKRLTMKSA